MPERLTAVPLPPYSYVPGKFPHPVRDPRGHSFAEPAPVVDRFDPQRWRECEPYLYGIDLFNAGYYWEAHEQWEAVWHAAGRRGLAADFLKGLIKLAAAGVKAREGRAEGVRRHASRGRDLFVQVQSHLGSRNQFLGLAMPSLIAVTEAIAADAARLAETRDEPVVTVLPFRLRPGQVAT